jgi:hypothetical protein
MRFTTPSRMAIETIAIPAAVHALTHATHRPRPDACIVYRSWSGGVYVYPPRAELARSPRRHRRHVPALHGSSDPCVPGRLAQLAPRTS